MCKSARQLLYIVPTYKYMYSYSSFARLFHEIEYVRWKNAETKFVTFYVNKYLAYSFGSKNLESSSCNFLYSSFHLFHDICIVFVYLYICRCGRSPWLWSFWCVISSICLANKGNKNSILCIFFSIYLSNLFVYNI